MNISTRNIVGSNDHKWAQQAVIWDTRDNLSCEGSRRFLVIIVFACVQSHFCVFPPHFCRPVLCFSTMLKHWHHWNSSTVFVSSKLCSADRACTDNVIIHCSDDDATAGMVSSFG